MNILNALKTLTDKNSKIAQACGRGRGLKSPAKSSSRLKPTLERELSRFLVGFSRLWLLALSLSLGLFLAACQAVTPTTTPEFTPSPVVEMTPIVTPPLSETPKPTTSPPNPPTTGGTAILGLVGQPDSLNPITDNSVAVRDLSPLLFDSLLRVDPQTAALQPGLAQNWEYKGEQVIFHLPPGLKWSSGQPLTAGTIAASLAATQHPSLLAFSEITASNESTLTFTFIQTDCAAVTNLALLPLLPAAEITATIPTGSGPFVVKEWSKNKRALQLTRNPHYRGPTPLLDGLTARFLAEDELGIALSEGQFDAVEWSTIVNSPQGAFGSELLTINNSLFTIHNYLAPQMIYLAINYAPAQSKPLSPEIRQALTLALDRQAILTEALSGEGQLLAGPLLPGHWAANPNLILPEYNPAKARALLAQAGLKDTDGDGWLDQNGKRLELGIRLNGENQVHQNLGWLVSSYYRDLGLFTRAEGVPFDSAVDDLFTHDFSLALFTWPILPDPDQRLYWRSTENKEGSGLNFISYNNPSVDKLLNQGIAVPGCDVSGRAKIYGQAQQILAEERPVDFLLAPNRHLLTSHRLRGLNPGPFAVFTWNITDWYLEE